MESHASSISEIILELLDGKSSERQGRLIDSGFVELDGEEKTGGLLLMPKNSSSQKVKKYLEHQLSMDTLRLLHVVASMMEKAR